MKSSIFLAKYLEYKGVTHVFELIGGMITHIVDAIDSKTNIKIISCHHEQCSGFAAEGYARVSGIPGIALATSGPGATNLITAIGSCYFDSVPTIFITGQVNTFELKGNKNTRQLGFQETDITSIVKPLCKYVVQIKDSKDLPEVLENAFDIALEGRQGPCLIDIPMNIQSEVVDDELINASLKTKKVSSSFEKFNYYEKRFIEDYELKLNLLQKDLAYSNKPLILAGGGSSNFYNRNFSRDIIRRFKLPVVTSLLGIDILSYADPQRVGFIGSYGNRWANKILAESDLIITLGSRLDIKQTGSNIMSFSKNKKIWQIDLDANEIGLRINPTNSIISSLSFFEKKTRTYKFKLNKNVENWRERINKLKGQYVASKEYKTNHKEINPILFLERLSNHNTEPKIFVTDVGQHQMWAAQSLKLGIEDRFITSGGMGAMGFGLPAAIGSFFSSKDKEVLLITGDGSFQLNIQELETIKRNKIPLKIVLFNNNCHGMVRQFQESYFNGNLPSTVKGYSSPDFVKVANAYGIKAFDLSSFKSVNESIDFLFKTRDSVLLQVPISQKSKVYPKLAFGRKFGDMEPDIKPKEMEST